MPLSCFLDCNGVGMENFSDVSPTKFLYGLNILLILNAHQGCICLWKHRVKTSRVTRVTLVLWIGNEMLRSFYASGTPPRDRVLNPYRITPIHWLMARRRLWRNDVVRSYWRTRHPLLRFLCRKEPCRQREELGSKRSVSFPIQRTRVTRVTRDVLFHR